MKSWMWMLLAAALVLCVALALPFGAEAEEIVYGTYEEFEYSIQNGQVTIEGVVDWFSGHAEIPETIEGYPVTKIGPFAFGSEKGTTYFTTAVTIPDTVTVIDDWAFSDCWGLTTVNMGNGVVSIGSEAFYNCINLNTITLGENVDAIHSQAFYGCENLSSVTLNNKLQLISWSAFEGCKGLTEIVFPGSVTNISDRAFANCVGLKDVIIPANVVQMGKGVFAGCKCIVKVDENNEFYSSDDYGVLYNKSKSELIQASSAITAQYTIPETVTQIGESAFASCDQLQSVDIPENVTAIGASAFENCTELRTVTIPQGVETIQQSTFAGCSRLYSVTLSQDRVPTRSTTHSGLTEICDYAFYNCVDLTEINIPDSVTRLGSYVFYGCSSLEKISIPNSIIHVGRWAFDDCDSLVYTEFENGKYLGNDDNPYVVLLKCTNEDITAFQIPDGTRIISHYAFDGYRNLTEVVIPDGVVSIGEGAFTSCWGLTEIVIPDSVISIGKRAFAYCSGLRTVTMGSGVTHVGEYAFNDCRGLLNGGIVHVQDLASWCRIDFENYLSNPARWSGDIYVDGKSVTTLVIPDGVTQIGKYAFYNCRKLAALDLPAGLTEIGEDAFSGIGVPDHITYGGTQEQWAQVSVEGSGLSTETTFHCETRLKQHSQCALTGLYCSLCTRFIDSEKIEGASHAYTDSTDISCNNCDYVQALSNVSVGHYPLKITYQWPYEDLDVSGGYLTAWYEDGAALRVPVTEEMISGFDKTVLGSQRLTITYGDWNFYYTVRTEPGTPDRIEILSLPEKLNYMPNERLVLSGLETVAYYGERTYTISASEFTVAQGDTGTSGDNIVILDFNGTTVSFPIYIYRISKLQIDTLPDKTDYLVDEALDLTGVTLSAVYENGTIENVPYSWTSWNSVDMSTIGSKTVTMTYTAYGNSYSVSFDIQVHEIVSLQIDTLPNTRSYIIGSPLSLTGMSVSAVLDDGSVMAVQTEDLEVSSVNMDSRGTQTVILSYGEFCVSFEIYIHSYTTTYLDNSLYPESAHDYSNYTDETKTFTYQGAQALILTFNSESKTESNYDLIYLYDGEGNEIGRYSGDLAYMTVTVPGDTFRIRLTSDYGATYYGYAFESIEAAEVWHEYDGEGICQICGEVREAVIGYVDGCAVGFANLQDALEAGAQWVQLLMDTSAELSLNADLYIDLNGHVLFANIMTNGYKIYGMDSATDDYTGQSYGLLLCLDENGEPLVPEGHCSSDITGQIKRYLTIDEGDGVYSFHRFYLGITSISVNPAKVGLGYKAVFLGDEKVQAQFVSFGYTLQLEGCGKITRSLNDIGSDGIVTLLVKNYLVDCYAETNLSAYVTVNLGGQVIESATHTTNFRDVVEYINANHTAYSNTAMEAVRNMVKASQVMQTWDVDNILKDITAGRYVIWDQSRSKAMNALSQSKSYGYIPATNLSITGTTVSGYSTTNVFELVDNGDGTYKIKDCYGRYLYMTSNYNNFNVSTTVPSSGADWKLVDAGGGAYYITNVLKNKAVGFDTAYGNFGSYADSGKQTALLLTKVN